MKKLVKYQALTPIFLNFPLKMSNFSFLMIFQDKTSRKLLFVRFTENKKVKKNYNQIIIKQWKYENDDDDG